MIWSVVSILVAVLSVLFFVTSCALAIWSERFRPFSGGASPVGRDDDAGPPTLSVRTAPTVEPAAVDGRRISYRVG